MTIDDEQSHQDPAELPVPCRYAWAELDTAGKAELWMELADWVDWLRYRYQLGSRIPPCWWKHEAVVEELTALMAAHSAAYTCPSDEARLPREDPTAWHTQWFWPTVERLTRISDFTACRPGDCGYRRNRQSTLDGLNDLIATYAEGGRA